VTISYRRARKPEEKQERADRLLATARAMLTDGLALQALSLNGLAREAGMAKSNVYRYFESREAVLLALLTDEWVAWADAVTTDWPPRGSAAPSPAAVAVHLARTLATRPLLGALTAALPTVLEQNLSNETVRRFKIMALDLLHHVGQQLAVVAPGLTPAQYTQLVFELSMVITGVYPHAHPAPAASQALEAPALSLFRRDYAADLERFACALAAQLNAGP
jgi:AcrR family transcriptional regulator